MILSSTKIGTSLVSRNSMIPFQQLPFLTDPGTNLSFLVFPAAQLSRSCKSLIRLYPCDPLISGLPIAKQYILNIVSTVFQFSLSRLVSDSMTGVGSGCAADTTSTTIAATSLDDQTILTTIDHRPSLPLLSLLAHSLECVEVCTVAVVRW